MSVYFDFKKTGDELLREIVSELRRIYEPISETNHLIRDMGKNEINKSE